MGLQEFDSLAVACGRAPAGLPQPHSLLSAVAAPHHGELAAWLRGRRRRKMLLVVGVDCLSQLHRLKGGGREVVRNERHTSL